MDFRRIGSLPPYAFAEVNRRKAEVRSSGVDVVDLGFGNPDLASPAPAVKTLVDEATRPSNHRYSASRGIDALRSALARRYQRRFGVVLDPETEVISTIGAKEGLAHLMWVLLQPGDVAIVPEPSYPIHIYAPSIAGAEVRRAPVGSEEDYFAVVDRMFRSSWPRPRVIIVSFPHNPTTKVVGLDFFERLVTFAAENDVLVVHDFAYADVAFDGYTPPSILEVPGAKQVAVEIYSLTKGHSMAGWRVGFLSGNPAVVAALAKLKSYLDYGTFQPIQIAAAKALEGSGSLEFSLLLLEEAGVAVSPGIGFGPSGEGHVRFALVEDVDRIVQAATRIGDTLTRL